MQPKQNKYKKTLYIILSPIMFILVEHEDENKKSDYRMSKFVKRSSVQNVKLEISHVGGMDVVECLMEYFVL